MAIQQNFIEVEKDAMDAANDDESALLSELLERAFAKTSNVTLIELKSERRESESHDIASSSVA